MKNLKMNGLKQPNIYLHQGKYTDKSKGHQ